MFRALCRLATRTPAVVGNPWTFIVAVAVTAAWVASGPLFGWSGGWVLWPATVTSVGAFLLVLLLQYSQNRDTRALQLKLDEVIRALGDARTHLVRLEKLSDEELDQIEDEFRQLREEEEDGRPARLALGDLQQRAEPGEVEEPAD
jgi:low affinity Fe/Cu permease